mgnify:CR=1 FL=1
MRSTSNPARPLMGNIWLNYYDVVFNIVLDFGVLDGTTSVWFFGSSLNLKLKGHGVIFLVLYLIG